MEIDTVIIAQCEPTPISPSIHEHCSAGCDLADATLCWLRRERELRLDLAAACGSDDAEVLAADLRAAERRIDALIAFGRWAA